MKLNKNTLYLTYSWNSNNKGVNGHTFELIEYFWILKKYINCKIIIPDDLSNIDLKNCINSKYNFNDDETNLIMENVIFLNRPKILIGDYLLIVDGNLMKDKNIILKFKHIFLFSCGLNNNFSLNIDNISILQDYRIYKNSIITIDYKKKILFSRFKKIENFQKNSLLYITKNCREISYNDLMKLPSNEKFIAIKNKDDNYDFKIDNIELVNAPLENIFEKFEKFYYTKVNKKFDCSPRFIAECEYYNKEVVYLIDYLEEDKGLFWRKYDIENNFKSIFLNENDEIIKIIKDKCEL